MSKAKTGNLFTDIYVVRENMYGENACEMIDAIRKETQASIDSNSVPAKIRYLLFKMTNYCNSDCEYCPHAINRVPREEKFSMPKDIVMRTIDEAAELGVDAVSISGGEPLLRPDIEEIIERMVEKRITPVLLTNGLLLDEKWDKLGQAGLRYVIISVDSVDPVIYKKQRGVEFSRAEKGIEAAIKMREKYPGVEIHVSAVLTKDNQEDFLLLLAYMNERGIKVQISPYHKREDDKDDYSIVEYEKISALVDRLLQMKKEGYLIANSVGFLKHLPDFFCKGKVLPDNFICKSGYTSLTIDTFMNVKPCWSYVYPPVGNLSENSLKEIWQSEKLDYFRHKMLCSDCEGCWYLCTSEQCMMLDDQIGDSQ